MPVPSEVRTGIPRTDKPGWWIVPPWEQDASLCTVVRHFLRFHPRHGASIADQATYYRGYLAAIGAAPTHELQCPSSWRWYEDLYSCIAECAAMFQAQLTAHAAKTIAHERRELRVVR